MNNSYYTTCGNKEDYNIQYVVYNKKIWNVRIVRIQN